MPTFALNLLPRFHRLCLKADRATIDRSSMGAPRQSQQARGGIEQVGLRDYAPGDDFRHIDWTLCARRDELMTRVFASHEEHHLYVLLDCSASMGLGSPSKFDLARQTTALLGYATLRQLGRVSVATFSDRMVDQLRPVCGRSRMPRLLNFLTRLDVQPKTTNLLATAETFTRMYQQHGPVVVISDLYDPAGFAAAFDLLRHRGYDPRLIQLYTPSEADPLLLGDIELVDIESNQSYRATITERTAARYTELFAAFQKSVCEYSRRHGMAHLQLSTNTPEEDLMREVALWLASDCHALRDHAPPRRSASIAAANNVCSQGTDAKRPAVSSHAKRGNQKNNKIPSP